MPFKNISKNREYHRNYMRQQRATQKGLTSKPNTLNPVKPANVKPEPCQKCQELAVVKKENANLQKAVENFRQQIATIQEKKREFWREQKKRQREKKKVTKNN